MLRPASLTARSLAGKALLVFGVSCLILASFAYGVHSSRRQNAAFKATRTLVQQAQSLFSRAPSRRNGTWSRARDAAGDRRFSKQQQDALAKLPSLPYLQGYSTAPQAANVTIHDPSAAYDGLNFVVSADGPNAFLMDMQGKVLHTWRKRFEEVWPGRSEDRSANATYKTYWRRAYLLPDGELLAIFMDFGLIKLDRNSNLLWAYQGKPHHDLFVDETGSIHVLTRERTRRADLRLESWKNQGEILEDFISSLSPQGKETRRVSVVGALLNSAHAPLLEHVKASWDILHTNSLRPIRADKHAVFKKGQVLISMREIHALATVDLQQARVTWATTGMWKYQHEPRLLSSGNVLLFDNRGNRGMSRAIEFDPRTQQVAWSYAGEPAESFYSREAGTLDRLPNGNTLITESEKGRAFEVTPAGEIVWEYLNPNRAGEQNELIAALYDVVRVDPKQCAWLDQGARVARP